MLGWIGVVLLFWGSAGLPGGMLLLVIGVVLASTGVVPVVLWELSARPTLLLLGHPAPAVPGRWWLIACFFFVGAGLIIDYNSRLAAFILKPLWQPVAEHYYEDRPALAPVGNLIVVGPWVLTQPRVTPGGIRGSGPGGGEVVISWSEAGGYELRVRVP